VTVVAPGSRRACGEDRGEGRTDDGAPGRRPLLRGWLHVGAGAAWLIGGPFLIVAGPDVAVRAALSVYVLGMLVMFGTSAAFHRLHWSAAGWRRMRRADHSAIFVGIAGTTTAVSILVLQGWAEILLLSLVWGGAAVGILLRQIWLDAPQWVVAIPYVVVGWCPLVVLPQLLDGLGWLGFSLMLAAGLAYTAGALVYAAKRPDPWPRVFGFHEVFHACTLVGAALFAAVVVFIALPHADRAPGTSGDRALGAQAAQRVAVEPELPRQHVVGVLAQPGHARLGTLRHLGEFDR
jgi:hemolysin III